MAQVLFWVQAPAGGAKVGQRFLATLWPAACVLLLHLDAEVLHAVGPWVVGGYVSLAEPEQEQLLGHCDTGGRSGARH